MTQQVQELIDKIKIEGIEAADQKAREIEGHAQTQAQEIIEKAKKESQRLTQEAQERMRKMEASTRVTLQQASRDALLSLRKEIGNMLQRIVKQEVRGALSSESLAEIIEEVIKKSLDERITESSIVVQLSPQDLKDLKDGFIEKLQKQIKKEIQCQSSDDIGRGFIISFDGGKSSFDFSDESLAEYLSIFLNSQVSSLLKESLK